MTECNETTCKEMSFKHLIVIDPLGMIYGSAGAFLSPENLVGRSGSKFPPDAAAVAGLFFNVNNDRLSDDIKRKEFGEQLYVAGPFWAKVYTKKREIKQDEIYVPIARSLVIDNKGKYNIWKIECDRKGSPKWKLKINKEVESEKRWQPIKDWNKKIKKREIRDNVIKSADNNPWKYNPILHPKMCDEQRNVLREDGLFLENAVQMDPEKCLVYLSTEPLKPGWYRFGGENHLVEIKCLKLNGKFLEWLKKPIKRAFALITPGVWGSNKLSERYPKEWEFGKPESVMMLTDKPIPYRYRTSGTLGRGRYAVPAGTVYVLSEPIDQPWCKWKKSWFPKEGFSLKHLGCGLCLPVEIDGLPD